MKKKQNKHQIFWDAVKEVLGRIFTALNSYVGFYHYLQVECSMKPFTVEMT